MPQARHSRFELKASKAFVLQRSVEFSARGESLFGDPIEAWVHGPVVADVFHLYKDSCWSPIAEAKTAPAFDSEVLSHIGAVIDAYGSLSASDLERLTHSEDPWMHARQGLAQDMPSRIPIGRDAMQAFYTSRLGH